MKVRQTLDDINILDEVDLCKFNGERSRQDFEQANGQSVAGKKVAGVKELSDEM